MSRAILVLVGILISGCASQMAYIPLKEKPDLNYLNRSGIVVGDPINSPNRYYPSQEFYNRQPGWALIRLDIDVDGNTSNLEVIDSSPNESFGQGALRYLGDAVFSPVVIGGERKEVFGHYFIVNYSPEKQLGED